MVANGESPAQQEQLAKTAAAHTMTVAEFGERYSKELAQKDRKDCKIPRRYLDKEIVPAIGTKPIKDVTTEDVRAIVWRKREHGFDAAAGDIRGLLKRDDGAAAGEQRHRRALAPARN